MDEAISSARIHLLVDEYHNGIWRQFEGRDLSYPRFPQLTRVERVDAFREKKVGVRSHFRLISLAVLCEYIPVSLDKQLSHTAEDISDAYENRMDRLRLDEPLVFLLIRLQQNAKEIQSVVSDQEELFEQFFILERQWRFELKFFSFLQFLFDQSEVSFDGYLQRLSTQLADRRFWEPAKRPIGKLSNFNNADEVFLQLLSLLEFLIGLEEFLKGVENRLLRSAFWHYFKSFLTCIKQVEIELFTIIEYFARAVKGQEAMEELKAPIQNLTRASDYSDLDKYLANDIRSQTGRGTELSADDPEYAF